MARRSTNPSKLTIRPPEPFRPEPSQIAALSHTVDQMAKLGDTFTPMVNAWSSGDTNALVKLMNEGMGGMDAPWGQPNRIGEMPGNGAPGDPLGVFHVIGYGPGAGSDAFEAVFGDTYVAAVEFTPAAREGAAAPA